MPPSRQSPRVWMGPREPSAHAIPSTFCAVWLSRVFLGRASGSTAKLCSQAPVLSQYVETQAVWQEIWLQWCQGWQSAHCPTVCQGWPAGWSLLPFYPGLASDQAGTMGYLASHVAQEKVSGKPTPALRTPLSAPLRRGPQSWTGASDGGVPCHWQKTSYPKLESLWFFPQMGEPLPLATSPEARLDVNCWNLMKEISLMVHRKWRECLCLSFRVRQISLQMCSQVT